MSQAMDFDLQVFTDVCHKNTPCHNCTSEEGFHSQLSRAATTFRQYWEVLQVSVGHW